MAYIIETIRYEKDELLGKRPVRMMYGPYADYLTVHEEMQKLIHLYPELIIHALHLPEDVWK